RPEGGPRYIPQLLFIKQAPCQAGKYWPDDDFMCTYGQLWQYFGQIRGRSSGGKFACVQDLSPGLNGNLTSQILFPRPVLGLLSVGAEKTETGGYGLRLRSLRRIP